MKKLLYLSFVGFVFVLSACKKDSDSDTGTTTGNSSNFRIPIAAPAGFSFPHTYFQTNRTEEFRLWVNGIDRSSQTTASVVFADDGDNELPDFNIKLLDKTYIQMIDPSGQNPTETAKYFFTKDSLFIIDGTTHPDTFAFAKGGYSEFDIAFCCFLAAQHDGMGDKRTSGSFLVKMTYNDLLGFAHGYGMNNPDSLAYYNVLVTLK